MLQGVSERDIQLTLSLDFMILSLIFFIISRVLIVPSDTSSLVVLWIFHNQELFIIFQLLETPSEMLFQLIPFRFLISLQSKNKYFVFNF
jgi:hypothetical protein